jgi:hypothetical protein
VRCEHRADALAEFRRAESVLRVERGAVAADCS